MAGYGWPLQKWSSTKTAAPTTGDDIDDDWQVLSTWGDVTNDKAYICMDNTRGAAVWKQFAGTGIGTVTSVALTAPAELSVAGSPITTSGTFALTWATQSANLFFAGPSSGAAATPAFRALAVADIPTEVVHVHIMGEVGNTGDGATTVWYLANEAEDLQVAAYVNGVREVGFTQSGDMITFSAAPALAATVWFDYLAVTA